MVPFLDTVHRHKRKRLRMNGKKLCGKVMEMKRNEEDEEEIQDLRGKEKERTDEGKGDEGKNAS